MSPLDLWVYRDEKQLAHGGSSLRALERSIAQVARLRTTTARRHAALEALVVAGELEAALADAGDLLERVVGDATDALASVVMGERIDLSLCAEGLAHARAPRSLAIRPQSGLAYDSIHPEAYAAASKVVDARNVIVIGVRAAGTTLAAITAAALKSRGATTERVTVRPGDTSADTRPSGGELDAVLRRARDIDATIVVVDEGSANASALLAIGEAVVAAGLRHERIFFIVGEPVDLDRLRGPDAARRWRAFRTAVAPSPSFAPALPGARDVSRGAWRALHFQNDQDWPAVIEAAERRKLISGGRLFKFEGLGSSGLAAHHRASALAAEGIALDPNDEGDGWTSYPWGGRPLSLADADIELLEHIARYCARRPSLCPLVSAESDLDPIVANNVAAVLGVVAATPRLELVRMATTDSRLAPHEWLRLDDGSIRKTDAIAHGDDRFFPGPTDVAWDLAGAIIEWDLDRAAREHFLTAYRRASGDDASRRIEPWIIAYLAIHAARAAQAAQHASATEARRLRADFERYRARLPAAVR